MSRRRNSRERNKIQTRRTNMRKKRKTEEEEE